MGTGASTASTRQWTAADEDNSTVVLQDVRPRTAANENLPPSNDMTGLTKLVEAKNKFMKSREKNTACFQKQVSNFYLQLRELMIVQANLRSSLTRSTMIAWVMVNFFLFDFIVGLDCKTQLVTGIFAVAYKIHSTALPIFDAKVLLIDQIEKLKSLSDFL